MHPTADRQQLKVPKHEAHSAAHPKKALRVFNGLFYSTQQNLDSSQKRIQIKQMLHVDNLGKYKMLFSNYFIY